MHHDGQTRTSGWNSFSPRLDVCAIVPLASNFNGQGTGESVPKFAFCILAFKASAAFLESCNVV